MKFDLQRVLESKQAFRREVAARPLTEKLRLLDQMRERALVIGRATTAVHQRDMVMEAAPKYRPAGW